MSNDLKAARLLHDAPSLFIQASVAFWATTALQITLTPWTVALIAVARTFLHLLGVSLVFTKHTSGLNACFTDLVCPVPFTGLCLFLRKAVATLQLAWIYVLTWPLLLLTVATVAYPIFTYGRLANPRPSTGQNQLFPDLLRKGCYMFVLLSSCGWTHFTFAVSVATFLQSPPPSVSPAFYRLSLAVNVVSIFLGAFLNLRLALLGINWRSFSRSPLQRLAGSGWNSSEARFLISIASLAVPTFSAPIFTLFVTTLLLSHFFSLPETFKTPGVFSALDTATFFCCEIACLFWLFGLRMWKMHPDWFHANSLPIVFLVLSFFFSVFLRAFSRFYELYQKNAQSKFLSAWGHVRHPVDLHNGFKTFMDLGHSANAGLVFGKVMALTQTDIELQAALKRHEDTCTATHCPCALLKQLPERSTSVQLRVLLQLFRESALGHTFANLGRHSILDRLKILIRSFDAQQNVVRDLVALHQVTHWGLDSDPKVLWTLAMLAKKQATFDRIPFGSGQLPIIDSCLDFPRIMQQENEVNEVVEAIGAYLKEFQILRKISNDQAINLTRAKKTMIRLNALWEKYQETIDVCPDNNIAVFLDDRFRTFLQMGPRADPTRPETPVPRTDVVSSLLAVKGAEGLPQFIVGKIETCGDIRIQQVSSYIQVALGWHKQILLKEFVDIIFPEEIIEGHREAVRRRVRDGVGVFDMPTKQAFLLNSHKKLVAVDIRQRLTLDHLQGRLLVFASLAVDRSQDFFLADDFGNLLRATPRLAGLMAWPPNPTKYTLPFFLFLERAKSHLGKLLDFGRPIPTDNRYL